MTLRITLIAVLLTGLAALTAWGQAPATQPKDSAIIYTGQYVREEFQKLMTRMLEVADLLEKTEPDAAKTIRQAVQQAQRAFIAEDMAKVVDLLSKGLVLPADQTQGKVIVALKDVLETLRTGAMDLDKRREQIQYLKQVQQRVEDLLHRQEKHEQESRAASQAQAMADRTAELGKQLQDIVRKQQELMDRTGKLPAAEPAAGKLAGIREELARLEQRQNALTGATSGMAIAQLPVAEKVQKELAGQTEEIGRKLQQLAEDPQVKDALKLAGAQEAGAQASKSATQAGAEMGKAVSELANSNKTTAGDRQAQAAADLASAGKALDEALAKMSASTEAGQAAQAQADLQKNTSTLSQDVKTAMDQAGAGGAESQPATSQASSSQPAPPSNLDRASEAMAKAAANLQAQQKDPALNAQRKAMEEMRGDLAELAKLQRRLEQQARKPDYERQKQEQDQTKGETEKLANDMKNPPGQDGSSTPGQQATSQAASAMDKASQGLGQQKGEQANKDQKQAVAELDKARQELSQEVARQEEMAQSESLVRLEAMLRTILIAQQAVNKDTADTYAKRTGEAYDRPEQLKLTELSDRQGKQVEEVKKVSSLVAKEGSSAVFPVVLEQVRQDMVSVQGMLSKSQAGPLAQSVQEQIAQSLKDLIDALQKEMARRNDKNASGAGAGAGGGGGGKTPLVPPAAELKMLRALQLQINQRTLELDGGTQQAGVDETVLRLQHKVLSDRQGATAKLARDLAKKLEQAPAGPGGGER